MIDIHSHILPGVDDGAENSDMSIKMLKMAEEKGTKIIVATPHFIKGIFENEYEKILPIYENLKVEADKNKIAVEILLGQEVMLDRFTLELCKEKRLRGINGTKYMLIEFSMNVLPKDAMDLIYELRLLNFVPIIAHPERYKYILDEITTINDFVQEGCYFQINTGSLEGIFGKKVQACSKLLVKHGMVNFIASDTHSLNNRCPGIKEGYRIAETIDKNIIGKLTNNLNLILKDKELNIDMEKIKKKKSIFSFLGVQYKLK